MECWKLLQAYITGNRLDRYAINLKLKKRIFSSHKINDRKFTFKHFIKLNEEVFFENTIDKNIFQHYMAHEYNLLGTGWKCWNVNENPDNLKYNKIAWNKDVKSGYLFLNEKMYIGLIDNLPLGVDIKVPWEFGRMYHWPQLALYAVNNKSTQTEIGNEFENQLNDFMNSNPLGEGVQFYNAMEMSIRVVNLLLAYDILDQLYLVNFSTEFKNRLEIYLYNHYELILNRLEKNYFTGHTSNHYLCNLCGLLWISRYFESKSVEYLTVTIVSELLREIDKQFLKSGCSFECSTGYHLLAAECVSLSLFVINSMFPGMMGEDTWLLINKMRHVIDYFTAIDGRIVQIGDNDSGRIIKLNPIYDGETEDCLIPREVERLLDYLILTKEDANELNMLLALCQNDNLKDLCCSTKSLIAHDSNLANQLMSKTKHLGYSKNYKIDAKLGKMQSAECIDDFGLLRFRCEFADLYIRVLPIFKMMDTSHAHNDVFSFQVIKKNERIEADLGSIVYTANKKKRYFYASDAGHNTPIHSKKIINHTGIFETTIAEAIGGYAVNNNIIISYVEWEGIMHIRKFVISNEMLYIQDFSNEKFDVNYKQSRYISLGYGQLYERKN